MKKNKDLDIIDAQFLTAVDTILAINRAANKPITTEAAIGKIINPNNRYHVKHIRNREKRLSQAGLCKFIKTFKVDANFFYDPKKEFKLLSSQQLAQRVATQSMLTDLNNDIEKRLNDFIESFGSTVDGKKLVEYKESLFVVLKRVPHHLIEQVFKDTMELFLNTEADLLKSLTDKTNNTGESTTSPDLEKEIKSLQKQLQDANKQIIAVQKSENDMLKKYLKVLEK